jgi:uncharacterized protein (DUF4415 family)
MAAMTERRRTPAQKRSLEELIHELDDIEAFFEVWKVEHERLPKEWHHLERTHPCTPKKVRVTAGYDADVVKFYRSLGQGYQARMNAVLRAYMLAVRSKAVEGRADRDRKGDPI